MEEKNNGNLPKLYSLKNFIKINEGMLSFEISRGWRCKKKAAAPGQGLLYSKQYYPFFYINFFAKYRLE